MANAPSVTAEKGRLFLLQVSDGTSPTNFVTVTGMRANDVTINGSPVDITNKSSNGWRELLPGAGVQSVDITASGVYDAANAQLKALQALSLTQAGLVEARMQSGAGDHFTGSWAVGTFKRSSTHDNVEMFDITLNSSGPPVYSAN